MLNYSSELGKLSEESGSRSVREETKAFVVTVLWYNTDRRHSSLRYLTPIQYYRADPEDLLITRQFKIDNARKKERGRTL